MTQPIQEQFINYLLQSKDASIIELNNLDEGYFSEYGAEIKYIFAHLEKYGSIPDRETFLSVFGDFPVMNVGEPPSYLIDELFKDYQARRIAETFNRIRPLLINGETEKAMRIYKEDSEKLNTGVALTCVDILKDTSRYDAYVERMGDYSKYFISTGFKELDDIMGGIDREEELGVVVARTNVGKSMLAIKMATAAAMQGLTVGFYSGEMGVNKVGYRMDSFLGKLNGGALIHGNASVGDQYKKYIDGLPGRCKGSFKVLTPAMINGSAGVNALRMFIEREKLDILFVDQLSLLEDDRKARVPYEKAANISKDLKNLQVMKRIPIISVSQQNRTKNDGDADDSIDTTQIAMSDRIAQDATFILGITRDKKDSSLMTIHVVKSRDSAAGAKVTYLADFSRGTFTYMPEGGTKTSAPGARPGDYGPGTRPEDYEIVAGEEADGDEVF